MLKDAIVIGTGACTGTAVILDELTKDEFWDKVESYWSGKYIEAAEVLGGIEFKTEDNQKLYFKYASRLGR